MPIKGAAYKEHIFVEDVKYSATTTKAGKKSRLDMDIFVEIPGVRGNLDAKRTGKIYAAEVIDTMRFYWERGHKIPGGTGFQIKTTPRKVTRAARVKAKRILEGDTFAGRKKGGKNLTRSQEFQNKRLAEAKRLKRTYTYRGKSNAPASFIAGLKTRDYGKSKIYIPDPNNPSLNASGLMLNSLSGRYIPDKDYINKAGVRVVSVSHVNIRVRGDRADAAQTYGGMNQKASILNTGMLDSASFKSNFPATAEYLDNAIYVNDRKQSMEYLRNVVRFLSLINKNKALFL